MAKSRTKPGRTRKATTKQHRLLGDLVSVGPATIGDLHVLGINSVAQLKGKRADSLYERLCKATGARHDPCVIDVFNAAIAQAENPRLPAAKCNWWYWSKRRKTGK